MQTLFDLPMSSSLSYFVAVIVILGLLAIFAFIVRRVAVQGLLSDSGRGRGPRLGVVDSFPLDRTRQLVIIRRDDVEHLVMIGGTNDVVIETNIIRALPASAIRDQQAALIPNAAGQQQNYEPMSALQQSFDERPYSVQAPQAAPSLSAPQQTPRLKVNPAPAPALAPQPAARPVVEPDFSFSPMHPQDEQDQSAQQNAALRDALSTSELQALAKRLEASMPPLPPKAEKPSAPHTVSLAPEPKPAPQPVAQPVAPPPPPSAPMQPQQPVMPLAAQPMQPPPAAIPVPPPSGAHPIPAPPMAQPRPPVMPQAMPMPPAQGMPKPVMPQPVMPQPQAPQPMPQPAYQPAPAPAPQVQLAPEAPKDRQAAALDENLRRLLGRKLDPR